MPVLRSSRVLVTAVLLHLLTTCALADAILVGDQQWPNHGHASFANAVLPVLPVLPGPSQAQDPEHTHDKGERLTAVKRSVLAGLSTSLGAGVVLLLRGAPSPGQMAFALALAAGVMLTVSVVEMWLPSLSVPGRIFQTVLSSAAGAATFMVIRSSMPEPQYTHPKACEDEDQELGAGSGESEMKQHQRRQWRLALILTVALTAHNFPEGLAVAVSSLQSDRLGGVVMAAVAVHNIPEGIVIAMPVLDATGSRWRAMQMATLSGLAEPLGAILAVTVLPEGLLGGRGMDMLLCLVGGIMSCVAVAELMPEARALRRPWCALAGLVVGVGIMLTTHKLA